MSYILEYCTKCKTMGTDSLCENCGSTSLQKMKNQPMIIQVIKDEDKCKVVLKRIIDTEISSLIGESEQ